MNYDCGFTNGNHWFRYRTGGILIHDDKMLFVKNGVGDYCYMIGGGVHLGETSEDCIRREFLEETGIPVTIRRLAVVCENFFRGKGGKIDGMDCHTLEFYYLLQASEADIRSCKEATDEGEELVWLPVEQIPSSFIKPDFIRERIHEILGGIGMLHVLEERDRSH